MKTFGTRRAVFTGRAQMTSGKLKKSDLVKNKNGKIVSKKKSVFAKSDRNPLKKHLQSKNKKPPKNAAVKKRDRKKPKRYGF